MYHMFVDHQSDYLAIKLHYGERFKCNIEPIAKINDYMGGKVDYVDNCDKNVMSFIELDYILFWLGYKDCMRYYYTNKNGELVWCLTNQTVLEICSSLLKDKEVEVLVKHIKVLHIARGQIGSSNVCS